MHIHTQSNSWNSNRFLSIIIKQTEKQWIESKNLIRYHFFHTNNYIECIEWIERNKNAWTIQRYSNTVWNYWFYNNKNNIFQIKLFDGIKKKWNSSHIHLNHCHQSFGLWQNSNQINLVKTKQEKKSKIHNFFLLKHIVTLRFDLLVAAPTIISKLNSWIILFDHNNYRKEPYMIPVCDQRLSLSTNHY